MEAEPAQVAGSHAVSGYLALSRLPGIPHTLESRIVLLAARLAAELSACPWCIERCRHECRAAGLSGQLSLTERDRAALTFVEAVARSREVAGQPCESVLQRARCSFSETELADLTAIVAEHHCLETFTTNQRCS
jgi:hypothetical protein